MSGEKYRTDKLKDKEYLVEIASYKNEHMQNREVLCLGYRITNHVNGFCKAPHLDGWYSESELRMFIIIGEPK
jgi:hypothetical protein